MLDILFDAVIDSLKLLPFLFFTFLILELLEHKINERTKEKLINSNKFGPVIGSILGVIPQCGFSSMAAEFYMTRVISLGTLFAVFLSTSDEMLPLFISYNVSLNLIIRTLLLKFLIGLIVGIIIDLVYNKKGAYHIKDLCEIEKCDCEKGIIHSSLIHTLHVFIFVLIINLILNFVLENYGIKFLEKLLLKGNFFSVFLTSLIGLIPNCSASILLTELYLKDIITYGSLISGLLVNSGIGILILFKYNKNIKENLNITFLLYIIGIIFGIIIDVIGV